MSESWSLKNSLVYWLCQVSGAGRFHVSCSLNVTNHPSGPSRTPKPVHLHENNCFLQMPGAWNPLRVAQRLRPRRALPIGDASKLCPTPHVQGLESTDARWRVSSPPTRDHMSPRGELWEVRFLPRGLSLSTFLGVSCQATQ